MPKKTTFDIKSVPLVSCKDCIYLLNDDGVVSYCNKIKMPQPTNTLKHCLFKIISRI